MLAFDLLLIATIVGVLASAVFWARVAMNHSMKAIFRLDGTERLAERANRRALSAAVTVSALTAILAVAAYLAGRSAGAL